MQRLPAAKLLHPVLQSERALCAAIKVAYTSRERVAVKIKKSRAENKQAKGRVSLVLSFQIYSWEKSADASVHRTKEIEARDVTGAATVCAVLLMMLHLVWWHPVRRRHSY